MLFRAERRAHDSSAQTPILGEQVTDLGVPAAPPARVSPISRLRRRAGGRRLMLVVIVLLVMLVAALGLEIRRSQEERAALLEQIAAVAAEAAAVQAGLTYVERHASYARRGRNGIEQVDGGGFIASAYFHRTSRECDPQLHTHVLVANRTLCEDGRWRTLDSRQLMWRTEMLKAAGAV